MSWQPEIEEIERRRQFALALGGEEAIQRHHDTGKMTARERIAELLDEGSFRELGGLTGTGNYDAETGELIDVRPANSVIGKGRVGGRRVLVSADDFTIRGGSSESAIAEKWIYIERQAVDMGVPLVRLVDTAGGSVKLLEKQGATKLPGYPAYAVLDLLGKVPVAAVALGSCAGLGAWKVADAHFSVMVKHTSQLFAAGPPVVAAGMGQEISKEELGGFATHARGSGVVDNEAENEADAIAQAQRFLSYLPQNVNRLPLRQECDDDPERREEGLLSIVPRQRRRVYKARRIIEMVLDEGSIFEIGRHNGPSAISCLARLNGHPVGVLANDPYHYGGAMTLRSSQKIETFVDLCDTFHLPLVSFFDQPGVLIGREAEEAGTVRAAVRAITAIEQSLMPWCTIVVRRAFGVAGAAHGRLSGINMRYAWPSASWGSIPIEGGVAAAYRRELADHPEPEARLEELENHFARFTSPFRTAERFGVNDVIDPRETRSLLCEWVEDAYQQLPETVGPRRRTMRR